MSMPLRRWIFIAGALMLAVVTWGAGVEPRLIDEQHIAAVVPNLPEAWSGEMIALIADLQVGMWLANTDTIRRIVQRLVEYRPAAVLIAGDFVYEPTEDAGDPRDAREDIEREDQIEARRQIREVIALLRPLTTAGIPVYAVPGNHDYAMQLPDSLPLAWIADELSDSLEGIGVRMLRNESATLAHPSDRHTDVLHIVGIDAHFPHRDRPTKALADLPEDAARVVFMHNPVTFTMIPAGAAPFAVAAHTHGGQIRVPFLPHWSWVSLVQQQRMPVDGWADPSYGAPGNRLYVNRGIGFSLVPMRIACPPELTLITLMPGSVSSTAAAEGRQALRRPRAERLSTSASSGSVRLSIRSTGDESSIGARVAR